MKPLMLSIKDAAAYAGLSKQAFNKHIRPHCRVEAFGPKVLRVLRVDVDRAVASHFGRGSLGDTPHPRDIGVSICQEDQADSISAVAYGTTGECTKGSVLEAALARRTAMQPKRS